MEENASPRIGIVDRGTHLEARLRATDSLESIKAQFSSIAQTCVELKHRLLLLDMSEVRGTFSTVDRYELGVLGGTFAPRLTRVSIVAPRELIDPQKLGVRVARNRGLTTDVFPDRDEALRWLLDPPEGAPLP